MGSNVVRRLVVLLGETYRQTVTEATIQAYEIGLEGLSDETIVAAGKRAIQELKFMPTPAELRDLAGAGTKNRAIVAWGDVQRAIPHGSYRHVDFQDSIINATIRILGGWPALFERIGSADDEKWYRTEFVRIYETLSYSGVDGDTCRPLPGRSEVAVENGVVCEPTPLRVKCDDVRQAAVGSLVRKPVSIGRVAGVPRVEFQKP